MNLVLFAIDFYWTKINCKSNLRTNLRWNFMIRFVDMWTSSTFNYNSSPSLSRRIRSFNYVNAIKLGCSKSRNIYFWLILWYLVPDTWYRTPHPIQGLIFRRLTPPMHKYGKYTQFISLIQILKWYPTIWLI